MGNESSHSKDYGISKVPSGTVSEWVLYEGRTHLARDEGNLEEDKDRDVLDDISGNTVTVFVATPGNERGITEYLQNNVKTLLTLRHPDLLRYLTCQQSSSRLQLVTEHVCPLAEVRSQLTELDISAGLLAILRALVFLHTQAGMCHNNVCQSAVFVTSGGAWRLGSAEFVRRFAEETAERLRDTAPHRYQLAIPPEQEHPPGTHNWLLTRPWTRDVYAYGVLVSELIGPCVKSDFPGARSLQLHVQRNLLAPDPLCRPDLVHVQRHEFFNNDFNRIVEFLENLVMKGIAERRQFFVELTSRLRTLPDELVASRMSRLLLSRLVLLDPDACRHLVPRLFTPRQDNANSGCGGEGVLPAALFRRWIVPQLVRILRVRDLHIRLVILRNFSSFVEHIPRRDLVEVVLPELLLGIRDSDDRLVAATLRALADLVPILGGNQVIGSHRLKLFGNGTPKVPSATTASPSTTRPKRMSLTERRPSASDRRPTMLELAQKPPAANYLPERRSPEGGERALSSEDEDPPDWEDWEDNAPPAETHPLPLLADGDSLSVEEGELVGVTPAATSTPAVTPSRGGAVATATVVVTPSVGVRSGGRMTLSGVKPANNPARQPEDEFERFSIQVRRRSEPTNEVDLFADMQPVIRKTAASDPFAAGPVPRQHATPMRTAPAAVSRLDMSFRPSEADNAEAGWDDGWGDEL